MKALIRGPLFFLLSLLAACGTQLVEFPADGGKDAAGADGRILDAALGPDARDAADAATDAVTSDAVNPDTRIPDGGLVDVGTTDAIRDGRDVGIPDVGDVGIPDVGDANGLAPIVISTVPMLNPASNVSITTKPSATFNKPMDATTITDLTFTLKVGLVVVPGIVSYNALTFTATFTPTNPLAVNTTYTANVTTGAEDLTGNPLANDHPWIFTTAACSQAPIVLGSAANFAVLAGSTVTNTGPTIVTGDLGVSPGTAVTGFPPGTVIGTQHAMDPISAQGILDLTTAYNNAAGRSLCPISRIGDLGGLTLMPGLYKSTSDMSITTADLTLDAMGDSSAVFIFQIASTLTTTPGRQVLLIGGARATNVFWQVGTSATLGSTTSFQGTIMADQAITLNTGATVSGRLLARIAAVTLDSNTITAPAP